MYYSYSYYIYILNCMPCQVGGAMGEIMSTLLTVMFRHFGVVVLEAILLGTIMHSV